LKPILIVIVSLFTCLAQSQLSLDWYKHSEELDFYNPKKSVYNFADSCIYTTGMFSGQFEMDATSIATNFPKAFFLMKTKSDGELVWLKKIAEANYQIESTYDIVINADNSGKIILGITSNGVLYHGIDSTKISANSVATGSVLFKMDTSGAELWHRKIFVSVFKSICVDDNNIIYSTGRTLNDDVFIMANASNNDSLWFKTAGSSGGEDIGENIVTDEQSLYVIGVIQPNNSVYFDSLHPTFVSPYFNGSFLAKYDLNGNVEWVRCFYAADFGEMVWIRSVSICDDKIILGGEFSGGVVKFFPPSTVLNSQNVSNVGSILLCYDFSGNKIWMKEHCKNFGGNCSIGKIVKENHRCWILTEYSGSISIDGGDTLSSLGNLDFCIDLIDLNGNSIWYQQIKGANSDGVTSFFHAGDDLILNISTKSTSLLFDNTTMNLSPVSDQMVLLRFNYETLGISENAENSFSVFPNPSSGSWSIRTTQDVFGSELQVFSISGELVYEQKLNSGKSHLVNTNLSSGAYLVRLAKWNEKPIRLMIK
jgi:hypothetical protein